MEQPEETVKVEAKPVIQSGERGLKLTTFDEMWRYAAMVATSDFCPKEFKGKAADCMIAIQYGMELGLSIMSSLRSIAVINGKPSIYGDALLAVCQGSPVFDHAVFARPGKPSREAREGWEQTMRLYKRDQLRLEIRAAEKRLADEPSDEAFRLLRALKELETTGEEQHLGASSAETDSGPALS